MIRVEGVDFDTQACVLRVKGRNIQENQPTFLKPLLCHLCTFPSLKTTSGVAYTSEYGTG